MMSRRTLLKASATSPLWIPKGVEAASHGIPSIGIIPSAYNMLWDGNFNVNAIEYFDIDGATAWNSAIPSFNLHWPSGPPTCTIIKNTTAAPDGQPTGISFIENSNNGNHQLRSYRSTMVINGCPFRYAIIAKANTRTRIVGQLSVVADGLASSSDASVGFDLAGGNVGYDVVTNAGITVTSSAMKSLGNGWWLCTFDAVATSGYHFWYTTQMLDNGIGTAARSVSYQGDGTSGVYVWKVILLPTGAWALNRTSFFDDFTSPSTIDLSNTRTPGFNWYIANKWLNCVMTGFAFNNAPPTDASGISVANSILTWADATTSITNYMYTATANPSDASKYIGKTFAPPAMYETRATWGAFPATSYTWPAFWADGIEGLVGTSNTFSEIDFFEHFAGGDGLSSTEWGLVGPSTQNMVSSPNRYFTSLPGINLTNNFHVYSNLCLPSGSNNGTGLQMSFFDGIVCPNVAITWSAGSNSFLVAGDAGNMVIILAGGNTNPAGDTWPTYFDYVKVYQP